MALSASPRLLIYDSLADLYCETRIRQARRSDFGFRVLIMISSRLVTFLRVELRPIATAM